MRRLHIVGRRNHGKTTLVVELVRELSWWGISVGTIKHSSHDHELDTPGKDSHRHRLAGGSPAAIITPGLIATYNQRSSDEDPYDKLQGLFESCDLILVEGDLERPEFKVEVWRADLGTPPLARDRQDILAVVTEDPVQVEVPVWPRNDVTLLAARIYKHAQQGEQEWFQSTSSPVERALALVATRRGLC
jgi:molybdopterin-guanine dinucleotide biosynthesis protein MobB